MNQVNPKIKYFIYARKSTEGEDRQVQSIDDQLSRLKELARDLSLEIKTIYTESKSAKKPHNRPIFDAMLERVEKGEAQGILCWQINRLSRNPVDSGKLQWLLQQGIIKSIRTIDREYLPEDNVLIFNVESGVANQYILDLRKNVERGIQSKLKKGWLPCSAPLGYLNTKTELRGENYIINDPERFALLRKAWDLMLTGNYTPPQILEKLNNEWGFRTRTMKRKGSKPMSNSTIYRMFTNIFYAGILQYRGIEQQGKHAPMVSLEEFDRVQMLLGRKGRPRPKQHTFPFTGAIRCGECGCMITAIEKTKIIKATGKLKTFTYYYCTRKKKAINCSQHKATPAQALDLQIEKALEQYTILPEFRDWALEILNANNDTEIEHRTKIYEMQHKSLVETQRELDNLTKMRYRDLIDDETFIKERDALQSHITQFKTKLRGTETRAEQWLELTERTFNFAAYARKAFITGDLATKREILLALGENPILKDQKLSIQAHEWLAPIKNGYPVLEKEYLRLELDKKPSTNTQSAPFGDGLRTWRAVRDSNP